MVVWLTGWTVLYRWCALRCCDGMVAGRCWWLIGLVEEPGEPRIDGDPGRLDVDNERDPHRLRVGFPPTGRTLNIGEQKRHQP
jgi:hypothetical protein